VYDFSVVSNVIEAIGVLDDGPELWAQALADIDADGASMVLTPLDGVVKRVLAIVAAIDRPLMLQRFQEYAMIVLSDADFRQIVAIPQINYDFDAICEHVPASEVVMNDELWAWRASVIADTPLCRQPSSSVVQFVTEVCASNNRALLFARFRDYLGLLSSGLPQIDD
jgi:hypothetical protein